MKRGLKYLMLGIAEAAVLVASGVIGNEVGQMIAEDLIDFKLKKEAKKAEKES